MYLDVLTKEGIINSPSVRYKAYPVTAASLSPLGIIETDAAMHIEIDSNLLHFVVVFFNISYKIKKYSLSFIDRNIFSIFTVANTKVSAIIALQMY